MSELLKSGFVPIVLSSFLLAGCSSFDIDERPRISTATTAEELGKITVSVTSIEPWADVAGDLQTNFNISEQQAYDQAIPTTSIVETAFVDALRARLGINLSGPVTSGTTTQTENASTQIDSEGKETSTSSNTTSSSKTEQKAAVSSPTLQDDKINVTQPGRLELKPNTTTDSFLHFSAATALFQEVRLLDRYVRSAVSREGYDAYVVRLQLSVQPLKRQQPFDSTIELKFETQTNSNFSPSPRSFASQEFLISSGKRLEESNPDQRTNRITPASDTELLALLDKTTARYDILANGANGFVLSFDDENSDDLQVSSATFYRALAGDLLKRSANKCRLIENLLGSDFYSPTFLQFYAQVKGFVEGDGADGILPVPDALRSDDGSTNYAMEWENAVRQCKERNASPIAVPLVVTDNLEGIQEYRISNRIRQASLAVGALTGSLGVNSDFERNLQRQEQEAANAVNSLYTVGRSDRGGSSGLKIRLGAHRFGNRFEMVPRSVQTSVVLLVPRGQTFDELKISARQTFVNAETGQQLSPSKTVSFEKVASLIAPAPRSIKFPPYQHAVYTADEGEWAVQMSGLEEWSFDRLRARLLVKNAPAAGKAPKSISDQVFCDGNTVEIDAWLQPRAMDLKRGSLDSTRRDALFVFPELKHGVPCGLQIWFEIDHSALAPFDSVQGYTPSYPFVYEVLEGVQPVKPKQKNPPEEPAKKVAQAS